MTTWHPSRYGAGDETGALNEVTPGGVVSAARLVQTGRVFDLAHVLHADVPAFPGRTYTQVVQPDQDPIGTNRVQWVVEQITATQQMGTHIDGLNHLHDRIRTWPHRTGDRSSSTICSSLSPPAPAWGRPTSRCSREE